jgi:hypothetical protein
MKILIPLLSKEENKQEFLEKVAGSGKHVTLLTVIDTNSGKEKFGFAASQIGSCSSLAEEIRNKLKESVADIDYIMEWGDTLTKIEQIAQLKKVDVIVMKKQQNQFFDRLVEQLKHDKLNVEIVE